MLVQTKALLPEKKVKTAMATSDQLKSKKLTSPCVSICQMGVNSGLCVGCYRTRAEIAAWQSMDQDDQVFLLDILRDRRAAATGIPRGSTRRNVKRLRV